MPRAPTLSCLESQGTNTRKLSSLQYDFQVFTCVQEIKPDKMTWIKVPKVIVSTNDSAQKDALNHFVKIYVFPM